MQNTYKWLLGLLLLAVLPMRPAAAQSGPYGNEWIVPGQPYWKVKIARVGLYKLDYQYLTQAGVAALGNVDPSRLQLWRRGREVAIYQGGSPNVLDASTYLEFYGQRNDGVLDRDYYKRPSDQPHNLFSFSTDTAAYFITYGANPGKRMAQPAAAGGVPHPYRLLNVVKIAARHHVGAVATSLTGGITLGYQYLPWLEKGGGVLHHFQGRYCGHYRRHQSPLTGDLRIR